MTDKKTITLELALYIAALCLALAFRLIGLGALPFNEAEAAWAWQAFQVSQGEAVQIGSQPAYVLLASLLFFIFPSSEYLARLLPALLGSMVIVVPFVLKERIGRKAALVAAFGLALDPLSVAVSRQVGSPMLAVGFASLAFAAWHYRKPGLTGVFTALFLLSGQPGVVAVVAMVMTALLLMFSGLRPALPGEDFDLKPFLVGAAMTLFVFGTLFMRYPQGLSAMLQSVPNYLSGWTVAGGFWGQIPILQALAAVPIYQPLALVFGIFLLLKRDTWQDDTCRFIGLFSLLVFVLIILYPGRQTSDLAWVLVPLWLLAGKGISPFIKIVEREHRLVVWGQAIAILVLLAFWWANLVKMTRIYYINIPVGFRLADFNTLDLGTKDYIGRMVVVILVPLVLSLLVAIVVTNWNKQAGVHSAVWGLGLFGVFYMVLVLFGINDLRPQQANELWNPVMAPGYADDLTEALAELSLTYVGNRNEIEVVYQLDMALLHWQLRDMPNARFAPILAASESPAVIINNSFTLDEMGRSAAYRGEKIALQLYRNWGEQPLPYDFDRWFIYRKAPVEKQWVVLWAREDIFVGYQELSIEMEVEDGEPVESPGLP
jgi:positive regulator of sigma E activity